jgi:hypothetical protein
VLEDLHWADRSTRDLLAYLAAALRSGRVMVVGSFRSDELDRRHPLRGLLGELARNRRVVRLELGRFRRAELAEQLAGLLGTDPPARLVHDIYARSQGNPFFAEELLLAGADPGVLPLSLQEVLLGRVLRLSGGTQQLLRVAAAAGPGVTQPLLAAALFLVEAAGFFADHGVHIQRVLTAAPRPTPTRSSSPRRPPGLGIRLRRTRRYRPQTSGKVERFHRTLLQEWAYARLYRSNAERRRAFTRWLRFYNHRRPRTSLDGLTPMAALVNNAAGKHT